MVVLLMVLSLSAAQAPNEAADQKELYNYVITSQKVQQLMNAMKDFATLEKSNPQVKGANESDGSIAGSTRSIEKYPQAVAVLARNGMTPREYVVGSMVLVQGVMTVEFKKNGTYKEYPAEMLKIVSPANLAYLELHHDELSKQIDAMNAGSDRNELIR